MNVLDAILKRAQADPRRVVLPEALVDGDRTLKAAVQAHKEKYCIPVLVGPRKELEAKAAACGLDLNGIESIDNTNFDRMDELVKLYQTRRAKENLSEEQIRALYADKNALLFGAALVATGMVEGMTAGAFNTTGNVILAAVKLIGTRPGIKTISSIFLMILPEGSPYGHQGTLVYADCGVVPNPSVEQLADIAISSADTGKALIPEMNPYVAMLSFSTKGSGKHADVDKVVAATKLVQERAPQLPCDGELQGDSALVKSVGEKKCPGSPVAGRANVLIFPDLDAGNIAYKLTQRLANAIALGPLLQGTAKPVNDLSRGATVEDVAQVSAITCVEAQALSPKTK
jgi:phosphate acetyltransferase